MDHSPSINQVFLSVLLKVHREEQSTPSLRLQVQTDRKNTVSKQRGLREKRLTLYQEAVGF